MSSRSPEARPPVPLTRLWPALERLASPRAVEAHWRELIGDEFDLARRLFSPTNDLATVVPHPTRPGAILDVVRHGRNDIVGVDREGETTFSLSRQQLVVYALNPVALVAAVAEALGIAPDGQPVADTSATYFVGRYEPQPNSSFPVALTIPSSAERFHAATLSLLALLSGPFLLGSPTGQHLRTATAVLLGQRSAQHLSLIDALDCFGSSGWQLTPSGRSQVAGFDARVLPPAPLTSEDRFPTPTGACWSDLNLRFQDGHTLWVSIRKVGRAVSCECLGLFDRRTQRPNKQWDLLYAFARKHGRIAWGSSAAEQQNQKRKERLVKALKAYFQIEGDPIRNEDGGWVTVFTVEEIR